MSWRLVPLMILLLGAVPTPVPASEADAFEQANKLYEEGRYIDAIAGYQVLLTNHASAVVHFNLGNAHFKAGQIGDAIVQYRLASRLTPRDPDVIANLRFAREHVEGPSYRTGWLERKAGTLTPAEWARLATASTWLLFLLLMAGQWRPRWRAGLRWWTYLAGALMGLLLTVVVWITQSSAATNMAVVTQPEAVMRLGPFEESQSTLTLRNGAELRILDTKDDWLQVTVDDDQIGWVQRGKVHPLLASSQ